jgi:hypothetical protein
VLTEFGGRERLGVRSVADLPEPQAGEVMVDAVRPDAARFPAGGRMSELTTIVAYAE